MEDRRHTAPWPSAPPSGAAITEDIATLATRAGAAHAPGAADDARLHGLSIDGRFRVESCIGAGGMARVYAGLHIQTGVRVAIKLIDPVLSQDPAIKQRLLGEARAMMELQSNHIVRALDVGALRSGQLYVVMEYLDGDNLDSVLAQEGPLPWPRVAAIGAQICSGLATAHRRHVIHRDIKPQNIFRTALDGNPEHIKLIDFGVAREVQLEAGLTEQGVLPGTPEYMAPELVQPGMQANARTDLYAVGVTLYKLLTGRLPFQGATYMETLRRHIGEPLVLPSHAAPALNIPPQADELLQRLLAKNPAHRHASADELADALRAAVRPQPASTATPEPAAVPRRRLPSSPATRPNLLQPSTLIPADAVRAVPHAAASPDPPRAASRVMSLPFVVLRLGTLMVVGALFTAGTFAVQPSAATPAATPSRAIGESPPTPTTVATPAQPEPPAPPVVAVVAPEPPATDAPAVAPPAAADVETAPPVTPVPVTPGEPETAPDPAVPTEPEPDFDYNAARKEIEGQHKYLLTECMGNKAKKPLTKLKFRLDVRANGKPKVSVFASDGGARACVRDLFKVPFDASPRGGAFVYTLTPTTSDLKRMPVDPDWVK
jgi:serine/threonine protein kinase